MEHVNLGKTQTVISRIGLGGMPLSLDTRPSREQAISVIHRALELGVRLIDTADSYCLDEDDKHHNERLICEALESYPDKSIDVVVATKGGLMRPQGDWTVNGDPDHLRKTIRESFESLGGEKAIPLWQWHAPDARFRLQDSLAAIKTAVDEGLIKHVGLSNVSVDEIKQAQDMMEIVSIQNRLNPWCRDPERNGVLEYCDQNGLTFLPWSPVGGSRLVKSLPDLVPFKRIAKEHAVTVPQVVLAWLMSKSPCVVPIPGATRLESIESSVASLDLTLSDQAIIDIDAATA
jgi:aryl-alcohol dehydrogenase-like predicted oxidoreductase